MNFVTKIFHKLLKKKKSVEVEADSPVIAAQRFIRGEGILWRTRQ